jgi:hypothetical protein
MLKTLTVTLLVTISITVAVIAQQSKSSTMPRERDRAVARQTLATRIAAKWKESGTSEQLNLIVLDADERGRVYADEMRRVFPKGVAHLPETLTPRVIYCVDPECSRAVQHLGRAEQDGFKFVLMRRIEPVK